MIKYIETVEKFVKVLNSIKDDEFIIGHHNRCHRFDRFFYVTVRHLFLNDSASYDRILSTYYNNADFTGVEDDLMLPLNNEYTLGNLRVLFPVDNDLEKVCEFKKIVHQLDDLWDGDFWSFINAFDTSRDFLRFMDIILPMNDRRIQMRKLCYDLGLFYQEYNSNSLVHYMMSEGIIVGRNDAKYFTLLCIVAERTGMKKDEVAELLCASKDLWA